MLTHTVYPYLSFFLRLPILLVNLFFHLPCIYFFPPMAPQQPLLGSGPPHYWGLTITFRHTTLSRTPLEEGSVRRRDLYLTTHNTYKRQTSMTPAGFEPTIPARERQQTYTLRRAATGIGPFAVFVPFSFLPASIKYFTLNLLTAFSSYFFAIISLHFHHTFFLILYHNYFLLRLRTSFLSSFR